MSTMTEDQEETAVDQQIDWIREHFGKHAAANANYGWFVDEVENTIATKVYGYGVLTSTINSDLSITHDWEPV